MKTDSLTNSDSYEESTYSPNNVTTDEARDRLNETLFTTLESKANTIIDAPTSLGKSYTVATTPWLEYPEITGDSLVIHIHQTTDARDEAVEKSKDTNGVSYQVYKGREDVCSTAEGKHDDEFTAPQGLTPSEWFEYMCDVRKNGFYSAHLRLEKECNLPCSENGPCPSLSQWWEDLYDADGNPTVDVVHMTANFAQVKPLIDGANLIFDERPSYALKLEDSERQQIRDSISHLLNYRSDGKYAIADITAANRHGNTELIHELRDLLDEEISESWYFRRGETHRLAPEIGLAMLNAKEIIPDQWKDSNTDLSGRRMGEHTGTTVVTDSEGKLRHIHHKPELSSARCIIGLDAFPSEYRWQLNTLDDLTTEMVLSPEERRIWRREERGLHIAQLGTATRSYTQGWGNGAGDIRAEGLIHLLRLKYGERFQTSISPGGIVDDVRRFMKEAGISSPKTMIYGGQNSRNDFKNEPIGLLVGCIDPGDKIILDLLALGDQCAWPEMTTTEDGETVRKTGRPFEGPAQETADEILSSVREMNLAQAAGRYARDPSSSDSSALVYVWSDACPDSIVDEQIDLGYHKLADKKERVMEALQEGCQTRREIEEETGIDKSYIHECLGEFEDHGLVTESVGTGKYGASEWQWVDRGSYRQLSKTLVRFDS